MATLRQKKLAKEIVGNLKAKKPKNKKELLVSAGYDETTALATPGRIIDQIGVKQELIKLGFDSESAKEVVKDILANPRIDPNVRLNAAKEIFKVNGDYAAEKTFSLNVNSSVEEINDLIKADLAKFRSNK